MISTPFFKSILLTLKNMRKSNWIISPKNPGENEKYLKPPPVRQLFGINKLESSVRENPPGWSKHSCSE